MYRQVSALLGRVEEHQKREAENKPLRQLHAGLRTGLSSSLESVEQYLQPKLRRSVCFHGCKRKIESVASMVREGPGWSIGWCDACFAKELAFRQKKNRIARSRRPPKQLLL